MTRSRTIQTYKTPDQLVGPASPANWAFWAMNENTGTVLANDSRSNLTLTDVALTGTDGTEWSDRVGWLSGDATALDGQLTYATDNGIASVCDFNNASTIIGFQIIAPVAVGARQTILHIGGNQTSSKFGFWMFQENTAVNDRLQFRLRDNAGTTTSLTVGNASLAMDGATVFNVIATIDNATGSAKQIKIDGSTAAAPLIELQGSAVSTSGIGDITFSTQPGTPALNAMVDTSNTPLYFGGSLRRLMIVNYGSEGLPSNISDIHTALYKTGMLPTWELEG